MENFKEYIPDLNTDSSVALEEMEPIEDKELIRTFHIEKLKDPHITALFQNLRRDPNIWKRVMATYKERETFLSSAHRLEKEELDQETDRIRLLAPMFSAIATIPEVKAEFQILLDQATLDESNELKKEIERGNNYVHRLVIGGGLMGTIFNGEFLHHAPEASTLTVDENSRLGGQFRQYGGAVISMNTQNAPLNKSVDGELANIDPNSFGPHAPVELGDLSSKLYSDNEMIGLTAALNQYLSGNTIVDSKSYRIQENTSENPGAYKVQIKDVNTNESYEIYTDGFITTTGLGNPSYGLETADEKTQAVIEKNRAEYNETKKANVITYEQFLNIIGDTTNPFPLKIFSNKKVVIVGGGHSGLTVAETLSHLGPDYRGSTSTLGGPREIVLMGTGFSNREEFLNTQLPRYSQLATVMKKKDHNPESKDPLITIEKTGRVKQLRENLIDGEAKTQVLFGDKDQNSIEDLSAIDDADFVILTTGFEDNLMDIFADLLKGDKSHQNVDQLSFVKDKDDKAIARYLPNHPNIVITGPAARMAQGKKEEEMADIYNMPKNPASMFSNMRNTVELARIIADQVREESRTQTPNVRELKKRKKEKIVIPESNDPLPSQEIEFKAGAKERSFPSEIHLDNLLSINLRAGLLNYEPIQNINTLNIIITLPENENLDSFTVEVKNLHEGYKEMVQALFEDELTQSLILNMSNSGPRKKSKLNINLEINRENE